MADIAASVRRLSSHCIVRSDSAPEGRVGLCYLMPAGTKRTEPSLTGQPGWADSRNYRFFAPPETLQDTDGNVTIEWNGAKYSLIRFEKLMHNGTQTHWEGIARPLDGMWLHA